MPDHLAMPSPARTVQRSMVVLRRAGYGEREGLAMIGRVCDAVIASLPAGSTAGADWVCQVRAHARAQERQVTR